MVETNCQRCGHGWDYTGQSEHFCTCPRCSTSVKVGREPEGEQEGDEQGVEGSQQSPTGEPTEVGEPQVLLQTENVEREVPVTDAVGEVFDRVNEMGRASEVRRQEIEEMRADVNRLNEQVIEIAAMFKDFLESFEGGEVEYETLDLEAAETDEQVADLVERVRGGDLSAEEALAQVDSPDDLDGLPLGDDE